MKTAVVGLGYVGLPLLIQFARSGVPVLGFDIDPAKVEALNRGRSYIRHIPASAIAPLVNAGTLSATGDFRRIRDVNAVILCVPTPLKRRRKPDISFILRTARSIAPHLRKGMLVVLESTTYPGTTEGELRAALEQGSGLKAGRDFYLAFSPEREDPGNPDRQLASIPKVIGGYTPACLEKARALYARAIKTIVPVSSCRVAEATKLLENVFRSVNIALVNELKLVYAAMGIDVWEVIRASATKPFGFMPFYPGPGLGGHCIPIDPFYLAWKARQHGQHARLVELAGKINSAMPLHVIQRTAQALKARNKSLRGSRVLVLGLAYKPDVDDDRESPSYALLQLLQQRGAEAAYCDPYIPVIHAKREFTQWIGRRSVNWDRKTLKTFDAVIIATNHRCFNYRELAAWSRCIVDTRNAMDGVRTRKHQVWPA